MWNRFAYHWRLPAVTLLLTITLVPIFAQQSSAVSLNGIALNSSALTVLKTKGTPAYLGPALGDVLDINNILSPPPLSTGFEPDPLAPPKGRGSETVWMYEGNKLNAPDPNAGWTTFVLIDNKSGNVTGVFVWLTNKSLNKRIEIQTPKKVTLGDGLLAVRDTYGLPKPFAKIGPNLLMVYPESSTTFTLDSRTSKVIGIFIGRRTLSIIPGVTEELGPDGMPVMGPDGMPMPDASGGAGMYPGGIPMPPGGLPGSPAIPMTPF